MHKTTGNSGRFGKFGGTYIPETLMTPVLELRDAYQFYTADAGFQNELAEHLRTYVGRETPLTFARNLTKQLGGARIYLKREDLAHTGAHKINNALGQGLLAKRMHKQRLIAETGAGQHGVATASVAAFLGLRCTIHMGTHDMQRQALNVARMRLLGAEVIPAEYGAQTLKDATSQAMRDWSAHPRESFYVIGSVLGPHPYPTMVRDFQSVIGKEARQQILAAEGRLPDELIACIGGGSNALGLFHAFLGDASVRMTGVEAAGHGLATGRHAARFHSGKAGVLHGTLTYLLQNEDGQINSTHSISAGLDYAGVGPEHAHLHDIGRVDYVSADDAEALAAVQTLARSEGILPALESAHALAHAMKKARLGAATDLFIVNLSGRGDKDMATLMSKLPNMGDLA